MSIIISDADQKRVIAGYYDSIELCLNAARAHIAAGAIGSPRLINRMFEMIETSAVSAQSYRWPDPAARAAEAARQDDAFQLFLAKAKG